MRPLLLFLCSACGSEFALRETPSAPSAVLSLGDGSLAAEALAPLQAELAQIEIVGTKLPRWESGRWRFDLDVRIDTPGGRLGEHVSADVIVRLSPEAPEDPEIAVTVRGGDWPPSASAPVADALRATWIGDVLLPPERAPLARVPLLDTIARYAPPPAAPVDPPRHRLRSDGHPTDVLFVLDNSISMDRVLGRIQRAFSDMARVSAFPPDTQIAVTSTIPADPVRLGDPHPAVGQRRLALFDPGFLKLVSRESIASWHENADLLTWRHEGCSEWFTPDERNSEGTFCLEAHTQPSRLVVGAEAGLTAFGQLLQRRSPLFRPSAHAHVVFVSDTHDPGIVSTKSAVEELTRSRPTGDTLAAQVAAREEVSSFRIHAIAPERHCTGEHWEQIGPTYHEAAAVTGGHSLDLCETTGYAAFLRDVLDEALR